MKKLLIIITSLSLLIVNTYALEMGQSAYLCLKDREPCPVRVIQPGRDESKVEFKEFCQYSWIGSKSTGEQEWVPNNSVTSYASACKSSEEDDDSIGIGTILGGLALLAIASQVFEDEQGYVGIKNQCSQAMNLAVKYIPAKSNAWNTAWWKIPPNYEGWLVNNGKKIRTETATLFYYAESSKNSNYKIEGDNEVYIDGKKYWMKKIVDKTGDTQIVLSCN